MAAERGSAFLLKIGNGDDPASFVTVAGLKTTQLSINGDAVAITTKDRGGWRELLSGAGVRGSNMRAISTVSETTRWPLRVPAR